MFNCFSSVQIFAVGAELNDSNRSTSCNMQAADPSSLGVGMLRYKFLL